MSVLLFSSFRAQAFGSVAVARLKLAGGSWAQRVR